MLDKYLSCICNATLLSRYRKDVSDEDVRKSHELFCEMKLKMFLAMERTIPNFHKHRRHILRSYDQELLKFFEKKGIFMGDLSLNETEYQEFNDNIALIIVKCMEKILNGEKLLWEIPFHKKCSCLR